MTHREDERPRFATRFGVIATTVGSAVGLGNIWRFPYEAGSNGGSAFLIVYLVCVLALGIPVLCAEFLMGRASRLNIFGAFRSLAPRSGSRWATVGFIGILASVLILSFYSVVAGWTAAYFVRSLAEPLSGDHASFASLTSGWECVGWTLVVLAVNAAILLGGVRKGIERVSNWLMPLLFLLLVTLAVNSLLLSGASQGLRFLFSTDFRSITPSVALSAMGQAFFSLSLGLGTMMIYGSYFSRSTPIVRSAFATAGLDTLVALLAGVIIFPAVFTFGAEPAAGPTLVFEVLPGIFGHMAGGRVWASVFFLLLLLASLTSTISMSEICVAFFSEQFGMRRRAAVLLNAVIATCLGTLCALSFGPLAGAKIFGMTVFNLFDFVTSNVFLPLGGMAIAFFTGWIVRRSVVAEQLAPAPRMVVNTITFCLRFVAPPAIAIIFLNGLL